MRGETYKLVIDGITELIRDHKSSEMGEAHNPSLTPDHSDHYIARHNHAVKKLREIRIELEDLEGQKDYLKP